MAASQDARQATAVDRCRSLLDMDTEDALSYIGNYIAEHAVEGVDIAALPLLSNAAFLDRVSEMLLVPSLTECIGIAFHPILPALVGRWAVGRDDRLEWIACALARLLYLDPRLKR
jgi:hypothetical protein